MSFGEQLYIGMVLAVFSTFIILFFTLSRFDGRLDSPVPVRREARRAEAKGMTAHHA